MWRLYLDEYPTDWLSHFGASSGTSVTLSDLPAIFSPYGYLAGMPCRISMNMIRNHHRPSESTCRMYWTWLIAFGFSSPHSHPIGLISALTKAGWQLYLLIAAEMRVLLLGSICFLTYQETLVICVIWWTQQLSCGLASLHARLLRSASASVKARWQPYLLIVAGRRVLLLWSIGQYSSWHIKRHL